MLEPIKKEIKTEEKIKKKTEEVKRERIEQKFFDLSSYSVEFKDVIHIYWWSKESFRARKIKKKQISTVPELNTAAAAADILESIFVISLLVYMRSAHSVHLYTHPYKWE